jgi:ssDNA-binding Zn-finger/Zn-ribbon topoisomerase 1
MSQWAYPNLRPNPQNLCPSRAGKIGAQISNQVNYSCPHCGKSGRSNVMKRWHFTNCEDRPYRYLTSKRR